MLALIWSTSAFAVPDRINVEVERGKWVAFSHITDGTHTDAWIAGVGDLSLIFTAFANGIEVRTSDHTWTSRPEHRGNVTVDVGADDAVFHMVTVDEHTLTATARPSEIHFLLNAMTRERTATITYGIRTSKLVDLRGVPPP